MGNAIRAVLCKPTFWIVLIYFVVPLDLLEDSIPVVGLLDDLVVFIACQIASEFNRRR